MNLLNVRFTEKSTKRERDFIEDALKEDCNSAEAWGRLAGMYASDYLNGWNGAGASELKKAEDALEQALKLEPTNPMALHAQGLIERAKNNHTASRDAFRAAHAQDNGIHCAFAQEAAEEINLGNWNSNTRDLLQHAIDHGIKDPSHGVFYWIMARGYFFDKDYDSAIQFLERSVAERPNLWYNRLYLVAAYHILGRTKERDAALDDFRNQKQFSTFKITDLPAYESRSPDASPFVKDGRANFRENVTKAWNEYPPN